ncbi:MAG: UvrD-helicase domain-containing protein [Actinomycetota bacterium]
MTRLMPPDDAARQRIETDLHSTLFVEAGAGSGKTTALVGRVVALVASGTVELANLAAITFTEKAGAELRDRVRQRLQERAADPASDPAEAERCRVALGQLDGAAIGTLHSFAQRILTEHPVEAQLPPKLEVLDEVSSGIAFDGRWARTLDEMLADPTLERTLLLLAAANVDPVKLRSLALAFDASWDLVEDRVPHTAPEPPAVAGSLPKIFDAIAELRTLKEHCRDSTDFLMTQIVGIESFGDRLRQIGDDDLDLLELMVDGPPSFAAHLGRKGSWANDMKPVVQAAIKATEAAVEEVRLGVLQACARHLGSAMRHHTLTSAIARRAAGQLEFHDLLVLARQVLRHPVQGPIVRRSLHDRYQRLLLDEFQDTDPIQIELAVRIAAADPETAAADRWADVDVDPGRLFVVGDPKQSIYRFRRADISTFLDAKDHFGAQAGGHVELVANFRTVEPVIHWVNTTFARLMAEEPDEDLDVPSQPSYAKLEAQRGAVGDGAAHGGPAIAVVGTDPHPRGTKADLVREAEALDVAHAITVAMAERWQVHDRATDTWRDPKLGDITILVPARTSLPFLEDALDEAGIPFRTESSSLVYASRAVRDLLMVLRAADDPTDHLRIVSALRTPLLACGDDDLFRHKVEAKRSWSYNTPDAPDPADGPVSTGLAFLRELHEARHWQSPAELLDRIARERRALELGFAEGRPRDVWRRLRFVIDQARAWSEATGGSLRSYLRWVDQQTSEGARVTESVLPETDDDAVRIMTIHAAKGLEFPITIVSGMSTGPQSRRNPVDVYFPRNGGQVGYRLGRSVITEEFETWKPIDEQMGFDERIRLLYVACTRACDHLVVSLHRAARKEPPKLRRSRTNAELLVDGMGSLLDHLPDVSGRAGRLQVDPATIPAAPPPFGEWSTAREQALAAASLPGAVAATALTDEGAPDLGVEPGLQKRPRDLDLPPWLKGRYGTAVGRAVHGVLQTVDLSTGEGLADAVAAQCQAEAVPDRADDVRALVESALASPVVRAAAQAPHWREVYACTPIGDRLLEGYVDLLYRGPDGLIVVDHKTSASADPDELDRRVAGYRLQGAAYAVAVGRATGEPVVRVVFLFLTPQGTVERELGDLAGAMDDVERLVAAGQELVSA